ncbi:TVP38/TMEM64 family protein [Parashewanella tropica]|uniref:TVP38/TMEM64 family protein n=1 Tax=Parashewanella tropica TaxID=2547970 RepID=UPI0010592B0F|nr:VTT domain-containing protein [Parashewanella tropica]
MSRSVLLLSALMLVLIAALQFGVFGNTDVHLKLVSIFSHAGWSGWGLFIVVSILFTAIGGARQMIALACGAVLGGVWGSLLSTLLTLLGSLLTIFYIRQFGGRWFKKRYQSKLELVTSLMQKRTWLWICAIRLMPIGSNLLTNIAAALSQLPLGGILFGSFIGYLPQMMLFSFVGAGIAQTDSIQLWLSLALLVISTLIGSYLYKTVVMPQLKINQDLQSNQTHQQSDDVNHSKDIDTYS